MQVQKYCEIHFLCMQMLTDINASNHSYTVATQKATLDTELNGQRQEFSWNMW